ncbi:hypothetical protein BJ138DRAFT_152607 [Hygrophoropsis aurantiaca]|uniref:Uncharacterized protein n=1 Tax=Hygrophoropsis aurantiaca TaxID=72124 RepID=A0ACB8AAH0_9AGAM|nr:hypothetical protein BJ138DRAFT_152607 [Hygrophoropsis aurantiaca]
MSTPVLRIFNLTAFDLPMDHGSLLVKVKVGTKAKKTVTAKVSEKHAVQWDDVLCFDIQESPIIDLRVMRGDTSILKADKVFLADLFKDGSRAPVELRLYDANPQAGLSIGTIQFSIGSYRSSTVEQAPVATPPFFPTVSPLLLKVSNIKYTPHTGAHKAQYQVRLTIGDDSKVTIVNKNPGTEPELDGTLHFDVRMLKDLQLEAELIHHHAIVHDTLSGWTRRKSMDNFQPSSTISLDVHEQHGNLIGKITFRLDCLSLAECRAVHQNSRPPIGRSRSHNPVPPFMPPVLRITKIKVDDIYESLRKHTFYIQVKAGDTTRKTSALAADARKEVRWNDTLNLELPSTRKVEFQLFERSVIHPGSRCIKTTREVTIDDLLEDKSPGRVRCTAPLYDAAPGQGIEMGEVEFYIDSDMINFGDTN